MRAPKARPARDGEDVAGQASGRARGRAQGQAAGGRGPGSGEALPEGPDFLVLAPALGSLAAALGLLPFLVLRPNRVASGTALRLAEAEPAAPLLLGAAGLLLLAAALAAASAAGRRASGEPRAGSAAALAAFALAALFPPGILLALALAADRAAAGLPPAGRISLGSGFWLGLAAAAALVPGLAPAFGARAGKARRFALLLGALSLLGLLAAGAFDGLSLAKELLLRRATFRTELARHAAYALFPSLAALTVGLPLGRAAARSKAWERPLFLAANAAQVVPTLALLGLLVAPLAALGRALPFLGVRGVGWAPASLALFLYALLPVAANARAGFRMVDPAAVDAGRGMGMGRARLFFAVELPLASPALVAGFRTALAQNMGNAVLAGLIGGGGLGSLVFLGLAQAAPDLVLLGALSVAAAAFAADRLLALAERTLARRVFSGGAA